MRLQGKDDGHMAVGGGEHERYFVYATFINEGFFKLVSADKAVGSVFLSIGG